MRRPLLWPIPNLGCPCAAPLMRGGGCKPLEGGSSGSAGAFEISEVPVSPALGVGAQGVTANTIPVGRNGVRKERLADNAQTNYILSAILETAHVFAPPPLHRAALLFLRHQLTLRPACAAP